MEGLEPPYLAASDPKSDVSANFTTWALRAAKVMDLMQTITHRIPNLRINEGDILTSGYRAVRVHDAFFRKFVLNGNHS